MTFIYICLSLANRYVQIQVDLQVSPILTCALWDGSLSCETQNCLSLATSSSTSKRWSLSDLHRDTVSVGHLLFLTSKIPWKSLKSQVSYSHFCDQLAASAAKQFSVGGFVHCTSQNLWSGPSEIYKWAYKWFPVRGCPLVPYWPSCNVLYNFPSTGLNFAQPSTGNI